MIGMRDDIRVESVGSPADRKARLPGMPTVFSTGKTVDGINNQSIEA